MPEMSETEFSNRLASLAKTEYREDYGQALYGLFTSCTAPQRERVRAAVAVGTVKPPKVWRNPTDYYRSDLSSEQRVRQQLVGLAIHGMPKGSDPRDDLMSLAHAYHSAALAGLDADALLEEVAAMSPPAVAQFLRDFIHRRPEDKSLQAWRLRAVQTPAGPAVEFIP